MSDIKGGKDIAAEKAKNEKAARLAEQLRVNLQRRKAQARARRAGQADQRAEGLLGSVKPAEEQN